MHSKSIIAITLAICAISSYGLEVYLGFDTSKQALQQSFFDCAAGRLNYESNGFAVIPYSTVSDFASQIIRAKKAGFLEVHLLIDPANFATLQPLSIPEAVLSALKEKGTGIAGVWIAVQQNEFWDNEDKENNVKFLSDLLNEFKSQIKKNFGDVKLGVQTTIKSWESVTGGDSSIADNGYLYYSRYGDSIKCPQGAFGFKSCYIQQIQTNNAACESLMNFAVKRISTDDDDDL